MIFRGIRTGITKNPISFVIFRRGPDPCPPSGSAHDGDTFDSNLIGMRNTVFLHSEFTISDRRHRVKSPHQYSPNKHEFYMRIHKCHTQRCQFNNKKKSHCSDENSVDPDQLTASNGVNTGFENKYDMYLHCEFIGAYVLMY